MAEELFELCEVTDAGLGRAYLLPNRPLNVGRATNNDIVLPYQGISRSHARLSPIEHSFLLTDLESHNGTLINGHRVVEAVLRPGDIVQFGRLRFIFRQVRPEEDIERVQPEGVDQTTVELAAVDASRTTRAPTPTSLAGPVLLIRVSQLLTQAKDEASYLAEVLGLLIGATNSSGGQIYLYPTSADGASFRKVLSYGEAPPNNAMPAAIKQAILAKDGLIERSEEGATLCQPIYEGRSLAFALYLCRSKGATPFSTNDLELTKAVGHLAIFGLARVSLGERLLELCSEVAETQRLAAVGQLAAGLIHEIRNPLGFVSANLQQLGEYADHLRAMVGSQTVGDPRTQSLLREIMEILQESLDGTRHIASLTRDVLGLTRKDLEYTEPVDLIEVTEAATSILKSEIRRATKITRNFPPGPLRVKGHRGRLLQVLLNLLANALQALPQESLARNRLLLSIAQTAEKTFEITIEDNGVGIPKENLQRLFEPFFTTKPAGVGTGLGLAISRDIIKNHGGALHLRSEEGKGTVATVVLPILEE